MNKKVIGLVGPMGSGKGEVAKFLVTLGFSYFSLSDIVREEAALKKSAKSRSALQDVGDSLRKHFGSHILAQRTANKARLSKADKVVIDGSRNPAEVNHLKEELDAWIIGVTALEQARINRVMSRNKDYDPHSLTETKKAFAREMGDQTNQHGQQVLACLNLADVILNNDGTVEDLRAKITSLLV